jgi:hypothetical protein
MNPGMAEIGFGKNASHKRPAAPWGQQRAFYLFPEDLEQSGDVLAAATTAVIQPHASVAVQCPICFGGLNRSPQHFILEGKDGVWDGTAIS